MAGITLKDGRWISFDDGLNAAQVEQLVNAASQQAAPAPGESQFDQFKRMYESGQMNKPQTTLDDIGQQAKKAVVQGFTGMISGPAQLKDWAEHKVSHGIDAATGRQHWDMGGGDSPLNPANLTTEAEKLMGIGEAKTTAGKYTNTAVQFLTGAPFGGGSLAKNAVTAIGAGLASEAGGQAAQEFAPSLEPYARLATAILGGAATHKGVNYSTARVPPGMTRPSAALIRSAMPEDVNDFKKLGDEAMLYNASPSLRTLAQGAVVNPSSSQNAVIKAAIAQQANRSPRLLRDVKGELGRLHDNEYLKRALNRQSSRQAGPIYENAIQNAPQLPTRIDQILGKSVEKSIEHLSEDRRMEAASIYGKIEDALNPSANGPDPQLTAVRLHDLRKVLQSKIVHDETKWFNLNPDAKALQFVWQDLEGVVSDILKNRVPGFDAADAIVRTSKNKQRAIDFGYDSLDGGKSAQMLPSFTRAAAKFKEDKFVNEGMKSRMLNAMGTQANDLAALGKMLGDYSDFNYQKIANRFGDQKAENLRGFVDRERLFADDYAKLAQNSTTASKIASSGIFNRLDGAVKSGNLSSANMFGATISGVAKLAQLLSAGVVRKASKSSKLALEEALLKKGPEALALMKALQSAAPGSALARSLITTMTSGSNSIRNPQQ